MTLFAAIPLAALLIAIAFDFYCLKDLADAKLVRYFPRETWTAIICLATPFGGISYLMLGRVR